MQPPTLAHRRGSLRLVEEAGVTLVEVLAAIFITGVGLLSLLALFPLGALEMARAIKSDRTAAVAADAQNLGQTGQALVSQTLAFTQLSMTKGSAAADEAAKLRDRYEQLAQESVEMEIALANLQNELPAAPVQRYTAPLLMQIRAIEQRIAQVIQWLAMLDATR